MKSDLFEELTEFNFSLAPFLGEQLRFLSGKKPKNVRLFYGTEGWNNKLLKTKLYQSKTKGTDLLALYAKDFNSVEVISTKYGLPKKEIITEWFLATPNDFKFSFKIPQYISHKRNFSEYDVAKDLAQFLELIQALEHKVGVICLSLPSIFTPSRFDELFALTSQIPAQYKSAVELRNVNFYQTEAQLDKIIEKLSAHHVSVIFTDSSERRDMLHMHLSTSTVYLKIMGTRNLAIDKERINEWVNRVAIWAENGLENIFLIVNEPGPSKPDCLALIHTFIDGLGKTISLNLGN